MSRTKISTVQRFRILRRDDFTCQYCGRRAPGVELAVDHVVAVARGGRNDDSNLNTSCVECNHGKGTMRVETQRNLDAWQDVADFAYLFSDPYIASTFGELVV